eukprot:1355607-Rhodomonas_salina.4
MEKVPPSEASWPGPDYDGRTRQVSVLVLPRKVLLPASVYEQDSKSRSRFMYQNRCFALPPGRNTKNTIHWAVKAGPGSQSRFPACAPIPPHATKFKL